MLQNQAIRDTTGTWGQIPGLSRPFRDTWQLCYMKGYWVPESEPTCSVEEIMDLSMRYDDSLSSLSLASSVYLGGGGEISLFSLV
jgi:hypothetical protein